MFRQRLIFTFDFLIHKTAISILIDEANIQNKGSAILSVKIDTVTMIESYDIAAMRLRLASALKDNGISYAAASQKAGASTGYVHSIVAGSADPGTKKLANICRANNISFAYVVFGFHISSETEELISLFESRPEQRDNILALIKR
ncbi:helix-turn-helix domain-containing protein [Sulfitobacter sp.]|uniref:helix-turn-helix domain-containing protein n=1 Tax=Sulfitobacter sp. TaxID=1903071 RepID=UPI003002CFD7